MKFQRRHWLEDFAWRVERVTQKFRLSRCLFPLRISLLCDRGQANFSACPVWMRTQGNTTNIIFTMVEKIIIKWIVHLALVQPSPGETGEVWRFRTGRLMQYK